MKLSSYTTTTTEPVYTPVGFPIVIYLLKFIHNWDLLILKVITPISVVGIYLILNKIIRTNLEKFIILVALLNPFIIDQFRDLNTEMPAMFLLSGMYSKKFNNAYFLISILIRPSYLVFIIIYILLDSSKNERIKKLFNLLITILTTHAFFKLIFNINFFGFYSLTGSTNSNFSLLFENLLDIEISNINLIISEIGRLFLAFSHPVNFYIGILILLGLLFVNNTYGYMSIGFILFHILWVHYDYVRLFLPVTILVALSIIDKLRTYKYPKIFNKLVAVAIILFVFPYSYQIKNNIDALEFQRGPYQQDSQLLFQFINKNYSEGLFSFHSPRVFMLFTDFESYKIENNIIENTIIICEDKKEDCEYPQSYNLVYENATYKIYEK